MRAFLFMGAMLAVVFLATVGICTIFDYLRWL